jgi:hypothetical protein
MWHNHFRAIRADIKEVKITNLKFSAKQEEESKSSSCMKTPDCTSVCAQGRQLQQLSGIPVHFPYCPDLAPSDFQFLAPWRMHSEDVSRKGGKSVLIMKETLWENNLNFVKDVPMIHYIYKFHYNCYYNFWKKWGIAFVPLLVKSDIEPSWKVFKEFV